MKDSSGTNFRGGREAVRRKDAPLKATSDADFESAIETLLLAHGFDRLPSDAFDSDRVLQDPASGWTPTGRSPPMRHGFKCFGKTLRTRGDVQTRGMDRRFDGLKPLGTPSPCGRDRHRRQWACCPS